MPLKMLIVGGGSIGERHLRCFQRQPGVEVALCEPNYERCAEIADRYGLTETFADIRSAADRPWGAAVVCTPAHLHMEHSLSLLNRTKAILIEKPLTAIGVSAERLVAAAHGKTVGVAYTYRSHPAVRAVRDWIAAGDLGRVCQVTVVTGSHFPTLRPAYRDTYYARHETGGGAIQDAATHLFDLVQHLVGRWDWIFCDAARQSLPVAVEDTVHVVGRLSDEAIMASIAVNQFMAPFEVVVQINGDKASARLHLHEHRYGLYRLQDSAWQWFETSIQERDDLFNEQAVLFLEAVAGRRAVVCSLDDAQHTYEVNQAALESAQSGQKVTMSQRPSRILSTHAGDGR